MCNSLSPCHWWSVLCFCCMSVWVMMPVVPVSVFMAPVVFLRVFYVDHVQSYVIFLKWRRVSIHNNWMQKLTNGLLTKGLETLLLSLQNTGNRNGVSSCVCVRACVHMCSMIMCVCVTEASTHTSILTIQSLTDVKQQTNICWTPHLKMSPKHWQCPLLSSRPNALKSCATECPLPYTAYISISTLVVYFHWCLVVTLYIPGAMWNCWCLGTHCVHCASIYSVTSFKAA